MFVLSIRLLFFASGHSISGRFLPFDDACCRYFVSHLMFSNRTHSFETLDFFLQTFVLPRIEFEFRDLLNVLHATIKPLQIMNQCFSVFLGWLYCFNNGNFFPLNRFSHSLQPSHKLHLKLGRLIIVKNTAANESQSGRGGLYLAHSPLVRRNNNVGGAGSRRARRGWWVHESHTCSRKGGGGR